MTEASACLYTTSVHVQKVQEKLHKQKTHSALSLCNHLSVVPDSDEWIDRSTDQHHFYSGGM